MACYDKIMKNFYSENKKVIFVILSAPVIYLISRTVFTTRGELFNQSALVAMFLSITLPFILLGFILKEDKKRNLIKVIVTNFLLLILIAGIYSHNFDFSDFFDEDGLVFVFGYLLLSLVSYFVGMLFHIIGSKFLSATK